MDYPPQRKRPLDPQLLLVTPYEPPDEALVEANFEIFLCVFWPWHFGHTGFRFSSEKLAIFSNTVSQSLHRYSYKGMLSLPL
jgi:hypothetical protein